MLALTPRPETTRLVLIPDHVHTDHTSGMARPRTFQCLPQAQPRNLD